MAGTTRASRVETLHWKDGQIEMIDQRVLPARFDYVAGTHGSALLPDGSRMLTHCNAGALATAGHGTALGVIRSAVEAGKRISVIADETRPFLQGARLTAWELQQEGIPVTLITDNMAGHIDEPRRGGCGHRRCRPGGREWRRGQ